MRGMTTKAKRDAVNPLPDRPWRARLLVVSMALFLGCAHGIAQENTLIPLHSISVREKGRVINLWLAMFDPARFTIRVIDNAATRDTPKYYDLALAMKAEGCVGGCNGGFFDRNPFDPVGLMISDGRKTGRFDPKSWMKGLLVVREEGPALEGTDSFQPDQTGITALIQSGPWLVRAGRSETDNNKNAQAARTFIGHDGKGTWFIGVSDACTLHELSSVLGGDAVRAVVDVRTALNFDGGPSTGLWLRGTPHDFYRREGWADRNYLGLIPKKGT